MTKKVEFIIEDENGKELKSFKSKNATKLFNKLKQGTDVKIFIQEDGMGKQFVGDYKVRGLDDEPLPPDMNQPPIISNVFMPKLAVVNTPIKMTAEIEDPDGQVIDTEWVQLIGPTVKLTVEEEGEYSAKFTPTEEGQYAFLLNAFDNKGAKSGQEIVLKVVGEEEPEPPTEPPVPEPPEEPPTPGGEELYDSRKHSKLHDGKKRTIKQEGFLTANGLGIECRASGNPRIQVNEDNTYSLITDAGHGRYYLYVHNIDTTSEYEFAFWNKLKGQDASKKKWSRHNEGGDCDKRFGGYSDSNDFTEWNGKREDCHNIHSQSKSGKMPFEIKVKEYHKYRFTVKKEGNTIRQIASVDGKEYMNKVDSSPKPYMIDTAQYLGRNQSYEWFRSNNEEGTGEIRIKSHRVLKA